MTNEKARDLLAMIKVKEPGEFIVNSWWGSFVNDYKEALQMAIEALEQQPCEDCISRQDALNCVTLNEFRYKIVEDMKTLPSVTPKEKTGHWKPIEYDGYADGYPVWDVWECSKCGLEHNGDKESLTAFCPDCGAKMVESQESEVDNGCNKH